MNLCLILTLSKSTQGTNLSALGRSICARGRSIGSRGVSMNKNVFNTGSLSNRLLEKRQTYFCHQKMVKCLNYDNTVFRVRTSILIPIFEKSESSFDCSLCFLFSSHPLLLQIPVLLRKNETIKKECPGPLAKNGDFRPCR